MAEKKILRSIKERGFRSPYLLITVIVVVAALLTWQFYKYKIANKNIGKLVNEKSKGLYSIRYDSLFIDEVSGILHVRNIEIIPDTALYNQMVKDKTNPHVLLRLTIPALDILRIKTPKALLTKEIDGGKLEISNPTIEVGVADFLKDSTTYSPGKDIYKQLLGKLLSIKMDSIQINHANLIVKNIKSNAVTFRGNNVSFLMTDLLIDSANSDDSSRILFSRNLVMTCDELLFPSKNKKYQFHVEKLHFISQSNSFYIGKIKLVPQLSEDEFARSNPTQKDRYDIMMEGIGLVNINRESLWHKRIEADSLVIKNSSFKIYRDLSYPRDKLSRVGKYPHQQILELPVPMIIKKIIVTQSFIEYKEKNAKSDSAGKVQFYAVHAIMTNVTNMSSAIARNNHSVLYFKSKFLNKAPIDAKLTMFLGNPQGKFAIEGNMGSINAIALNPLTQPMGLARLEKGNVSKMQFNFTGNDSSSDGKLTILYNDLKISLLKKDKEQNKYDKKFLPSLAANIIVKNSNPGKNEKTRVANVHYNRDTNKSFFNLLWKSIFTGIKESAGMK
jgi:hypothetical protein